MSDLPTRHADVQITTLPTEAMRSEGLNRLRTQSEQEDASAWRTAAGDDAKRIDSLVRRER